MTFKMANFIGFDIIPNLKLLKTIAAILLLTIFPGQGASASQFIQSDICVYGGTSGGVIAAVAGARLGKSVVLVMPDRHVGGMTSGGLGVTDVGNSATIGGMAREFYLRTGQHYGSTNPVYWFEPHVAEQTFLQMLAEVNIPIYTNQQLASVTLSNQVISQITMSDGTAYVAKEFIDTTYEGDLMAAAGVSFTVGREGTSVYGESLAGIHTPTHSYSYSPYVNPADTNSGLLPFVQSGSPGVVGQGDNKVQCYNFRLCLTQVASNQIPITAPANYSESNYALFSNYIAAYVASAGSVTLPQLINIQNIIPNNKTDINADGELSTDYIGYNFTYPTNTYAGRAVIYQAHKDYIAGLLYYLGTSQSVPLNVRTNMLTWGYAKDEFQGNGGWPYPLYVREARRMVSDYVMQQGDALGSRAATDPVVLGSYSLDCHPLARLAYNGLTSEEGGIGVTVTSPFPISYRSIVPATGQCQNLFCTFALSASHVGFAAVRLEPPFMMLSQSAATAAAFAIDDKVAVQQVSYSKLAAELIGDGQLLTWNSGQSVGTNGIILTVNNTSGISFAGSWAVGANNGGWPLPNGTYWHDQASGKGTKWVKFTPTLPTNGTYDVYTWWVADPNRSTNVPVDISYPGGTTRVLVNQQVTVTNWVYLLTTNFNAGTNASVTIRNDGTASGTYVIANAVRWMPTGAIAPPPTNPPPAVAIVASDARAGEYQTNAGRFSVISLNGTNGSPLTVNYSVSGTAANGSDYATLSGSIVIPAGALSAPIQVSPAGGALSADSATVTLTLLSSTNYTVTNPSSATVTIYDRPLSAWERDTFTPSQLADPQIGGIYATPVNDGWPNLVKYALGLSPFTNYGTVIIPQITNGYFTITCPQSLSATDVTVEFQYSSDLQTWYSGPGFIAPVSSVYKGATELVTWQAAQPVSAGKNAYVRLVTTLK